MERRCRKKKSIAGSNYGNHGDGILKALSGWKEQPFGQPNWRWFTRGEENAYYYNFTNEIFFAKSWREAIADLPVWINTRGKVILEILFVDPTEIKKTKVIIKKIREGTGNFQSSLWEKIR